MPKLFGRNFSRREILEKSGRIEQIGGVQPLTLVEAAENGTRAFLLRTGTGLEITVGADRALDLVGASWQGRSLAWQSPAGIVSPAFYDSQGLGWLWSFPGGLLTTGGLAWYGAPQHDPQGGVEGTDLGLHGRISHIPAREVSYGGAWQGDEYEMFVEGRMVEWVLHGYHLELRRRISARLGENVLHVHDVVTNCGGAPQEHQLLYHCNLGFPLLDAGARYLFPSQRVTARTPWALEALADWDKFAAPQAGLDERVYYHEVAADAQGQTCLALVNRDTDPAQPLGLAMRYSRAALPWLMQWKNPVPGSYVTGLEPGTNQLDGRVAERQAGRMILLQPGESRTYDLEMQVLTSEAEVAAVESEISALTGGKAPELAKEAAVAK